MTEEEKEAIDILKEIKDIRGIRQDETGEHEDLYALDIVYNLIDKQQKEIEIHKETENDYEHEIKRYEEEIEELKDIKDMVQVLFDNKLPNERLILITNDHLKNTGFNYLLDNYISKDKIRDKIKELKELPQNQYIYLSGVIDEFKKLLKE